MAGRSGRPLGFRASNRRLDFESLEPRVVLSASSPWDLDSPLVQTADGEIAQAAVIDSLVQTLPYYRFAELRPDQVPLLTTAQLASIPTIGSFGEMSAAARAALTLPQVRALNVAELRILLLTPQQVSWLTTGQIQSLRFYDFNLLSPAQTPLLTPQQIQTIPDTGSFAMWSAPARAALVSTQVQSLNTATIRLELFTPTQISSLTSAQIRALDFYQFKYLSASQVQSLTPSQIRTIPDVGTFAQWSVAARGALTVNQILFLDVGSVGTGLLTQEQVNALSVSQIQQLRFFDFKDLASFQTPALTPAQIATIPDTGTLILWSTDARKALIASQIQALNTGTIRLDLLTPQQISWLTPQQVRAVDFYQFPLLNEQETPLLTAAQIATIPDVGTLSQWSDAARAALTASQIQALRPSTLRLSLLTSAQVGWLTVPQIRSLDFFQFPYLQPWQIAALTTAQIASIPDPGTFGSWSEAARTSLTPAQLQSLNAAKVRLYLLTSDQINSLSVAQVQSLDSFEFARLNPEQIPLLTAQQIASMPDEYSVRQWSDQQMAALTREQILAMPYAVYGAYISLQKALRPPTNYDPIDPVHAGHGGHGDLDAPSGEADQVFSLVPIQSATHITVGSGNWTDPRIWSGGVVPGAGAKVVVRAGTSVRFDAYMDTAIFTLRIDGVLKFATDVNTQLKADTIVVTTPGVLHIGSAEAPIADNVTARILIADNGPINTAWDPYLWSRGLVSRGEVRMMGRVVTPYVNLAVDPRAGDTTLVLAESVAGWRVGDEVVIGGTNPYTDDFGTDRVRIRAINGTVVTVDPLRYGHDAPDGFGLSIQVANLNRNVQFVAEDSSVVLERPHIAFIHNPDVVVENVGIYGFGRTDKDAPINSSVVENGVLKPGTGTNPRARYAIHFHHTGVNPNIAPAVVRGTVVVGSPGWGFVNHNSNVVMENNVAFGVVGAGFVTEDGNEIGAMRGNLAMNMYGSGDGILSRQDNHDFGHGGHGFWFQGPGIEVVNNIAVGTREAAFAYITQSSKNLFDAVNLDPALAGGRLAVPVGTVPLKKFDGNIAATSKTGLEIWHHMTLMPDGPTTLINNFTSWNSRYAGIDLLYTGHVTISNSKLLGDFNFFAGVGIGTNRLTQDIVVANTRVEGFEIGIDLPVRRQGVVYGGRIVAVEALYIEKGYDTMRTINIGGPLRVISPTPAQLRGRTFYSVYGGGPYDFEYPNFLDRRVDSLLTQDNTRVSINGSAPGQLYFYEQTPGFVPFPAATSMEYVPAEYLNKTNEKLRAEFGVSYGGDLLPSNITEVSGVFGFMRY